MVEIEKPRISCFDSAENISYLLGNSYYFIARGTSFQYLINLYNHIFSCTRNGVTMAVPYMVMGILINKYAKTKERRNYYILVLPLILVAMIS